ncbi:TPR domain protein [alpha proteobacterium U9-1i]|nr:TPR domain protein [alpha proteobacterium U9-1i]
MNDEETLRHVHDVLLHGDAARAESMIAARWPNIATASEAKNDISAFVVRAQQRVAMTRSQRRLVRSEPRAPVEALYLLGLVRRLQRRPRDAADMFRAAVRAKADDPRYHFALGDALSWLNDGPSSADSFAAALRLDPNFPDARRAFARAALAAGRLVEAEEAARALLVTGADADAWDILSCALRAQGKLEHALQAAECAMHADSGSVSARFNWALTAGRLGKLEDALAGLEAIAADGVESAVVATARATALQQLGRMAEGEHVLHEAAKRFPSDVAVQTALAKARWQNGAGAAFADAYEQAVALKPDACALRANCAQLLRAAGFTERAEVLLRDGLRRNPAHPALLYELGAALAEQGSIEDACEVLERALIVAPNVEPLRIRWALTLLQLGRGAEVLSVLERLRREAPLNQNWIAIESLALRQLDHPRYNWLCDYDYMVQHHDLAPPTGFSSVAEFNEELAERLRRLHVTKAHPLDQTLRDGTQGRRNLVGLKDPVVRCYLDALHEPIRAYIARMRDKNHPWSGRKTEAFKLASAWSVRLRAGGYHLSHVHPDGWISSVYYTALPASMARSRRNEGWLKLGEPPCPIEKMPAEKMIEPKVGRLVLFPSYFWHGTIAFSDGERMTAPFDVVPA